MSTAKWAVSVVAFVATGAVFMFIGRIRAWLFEAAYYGTTQDR